MCRVIEMSVIVVLLLVFPRCYGYKWVHIPIGDPMPKQSVKLSNYDNDYDYRSSSSTTYVGRARHYADVLPAEIYNSSFATIYSCSNKIIKRHFEVLVAQEHCEWHPYTSYEEIPENIVYIGHYQDNEPIYAARSGNRNSQLEIASLLLKSQMIVSKTSNNYYILTCNDDDDWIDVAATAIPNNTISGGLSHNNNSIFVARLKDDCNIVPAQVIPQLGVAINERQKIKSPYCQVLVGEPGDYIWETAEGGLIPDFAVVSGKTGTELQYITRMNRSLGYLTYSMAIKEEDPYEILIKVKHRM